MGGGPGTELITRCHVVGANHVTDIHASEGGDRPSLCSAIDGLPSVQERAVGGPRPRRDHLIAAADPRSPGPLASELHAGISEGDADRCGAQIDIEEATDEVEEASEESSPASDPPVRAITPVGPPLPGK